MYDSYGDGWNGARYDISGPEGEFIASGGFDDGFFHSDTLCLFESNDFTITVGGGSYDEEISFELVDAFGDVIYFGYAQSEPVTFAVTGVQNIIGCTDPSAINYDPFATADNGSCYYSGEICEVPLYLSPSTDENGNAEAVGTADASTDQWFKYTVQNTGNLTVTSVGLTDLDTYLQITSSCAIDSTLEVDEDGEEYWYYFYPDLIAEVDDIVVGTSIVYQSEASFCVVAGQEILINWIPYYTPGGEFQFAVSRKCRHYYTFKCFCKWWTRRN